MERTHTDILKGLVSAGKRWRYGEKADNLVTRRIVWELKHIIDAGFVDYYVMAFWIFKYSKQDINYWARGAMPSSIVCYCLGLTEVDPIKYGLHSARFVNEEPPKFQFDIEASRFNEFMKKAEDMLQANEEDFDIPAIRECLFKDVKPYEYLNKKQERPLPTGLEDEFARYALYRPDTLDLFDAYIQNPKSDILIYQEQMLDILKEVFHVGGIKANQIRLNIQRGETEQIEAYKQELFASSNLPDEEKEKAWKRLTSNPRAFLKAHAVSQVLEKYIYEKNIKTNIIMEIRIKNKEGEFLPTGFTQLDELIQGWRTSELIVIAGRPGMGKTTFTLSMIRRMAFDQKIPCALFSMEMNSAQVIQRLGINTNNTSLFINDSPLLTVLELQSKARKLVAEDGVRVIFIDYLQLFGMPLNVKGLFETIAEERSYILCRLKLLSLELNVPIIVLSQLNCPVDEKRIRPDLADFRDLQSAIELCADKVCFIHRPEYYHLQGGAEFIIHDIRKKKPLTLTFQFENIYDSNN